MSCKSEDRQIAESPNRQIPMTPSTILLTGGAGFVGSNLALHLKQTHPGARVVAVDNLKRRGSELNLPRLAQGGVEFVHGDVRNREDLECGVAADLLLECSAEPSVLAGIGSPPDYVVQTNLVGTLNVLEYCRRHGTAMIFLSTSRVYPIEALCRIRLVETPSRFEIAAEQELPGISSRGISEEFPLAGARSLYGASKLASELFIEEYVEHYGVPIVVDRCGVIAGPWQMGKVDQGVVSLWVARHVFGRGLSYIGYGGAGKQVRDVLHVGDLCDLVDLQIARLESLSGRTFNAGGGREVSASLAELTELCRAATGRTVPIDSVPETRAADVPLYITDNTRLSDELGWKPARTMERIVADVHAWIIAHRRMLEPILG
jgi:CDP-paratose 2-epimerase